LETQEDQAAIEDLREIAALRHSFHIDGRLRLEFLSVVSKLLREHQVPVSNRLLSSLTLAVADELSNGNGHGHVGLEYVTQAATKKGPKPPHPPMPPIPPGRKKKKSGPPVPLIPRPPRPPRPPIPPS
jgi:hypothetical protein